MMFVDCLFYFGLFILIGKVYCLSNLIIFNEQATNYNSLMAAYQNRKSVKIETFLNIRSQNLTGNDINIPFGSEKEYPKIVNSHMDNEDKVIFCLICKKVLIKIAVELKNVTHKSYLTNITMKLFKSKIHL